MSVFLKVVTKGLEKGSLSGLTYLQWNESDYLSQSGIIDATK